MSPVSGIFKIKPEVLFPNVKYSLFNYILVAAIPFVCVYLETFLCNFTTALIESVGARIWQVGTSSGVEFSAGSVV